jgi:CRISPR/Cas system-associated endonuclease Cas1
MAQSKATKSLERVCSLTLDMEEPLRDATAFVLALRLIGQGLLAHDNEEGRAVAAIAWAASDRLDALKQTWDRTYKATRK